MKFLLYKGGRIELNYDRIHQLTTTQIIILRNQLMESLIIHSDEYRKKYPRSPK